MNTINILATCRSKAKQKYSATTFNSKKLGSETQLSLTFEKL